MKPAKQTRNARAGEPTSFGGPALKAGPTAEAAQALAKLRMLDRDLADCYEKTRLERRKVPRG